MKYHNQRYTIQGIPVQTICKDFGTPLYVYDSEVIINQIEKLKFAFSGFKCKLKYAAKALTNSSILKLIHKQGCDVEAVSIEEVEICLNAGFSPNEIAFTPNSVHFSEIEKAIALGVFINIDNLHILNELGKNYGSSVPCSVRINPHILAGGNQKISVGHKDSKFGISIDYIDQVVQIAQKYKINLKGVHVHTGSDFSDVDVFMQGAQVLFNVAKKFSSIEIIDFGSGFKVPYKPGDKATDITLLGQKMTEAVKKFGKEYGREPEIWFEPGKYLVSDSGILFVHSNVLKKAHNTTFVGVDSGFNHLIRPMMYDSYHHIINVSNPEGEKGDFSVVGNICETDTFAWQRELSQVSEGDILAIMNAGAYGFSMSSNYNSRPRPAEVMVYNGEAHLIRKRESVADIIRTEVPMEF
ncbi:MAG: diaminopimelate decarboxylase [Bacteroidota bacterium]|nr:diaminopimelate decarboxylase [Bacteroidota bacterium]